MSEQQKDAEFRRDWQQMLDMASGCERHEVALADVAMANAVRSIRNAAKSVAGAGDDVEVRFGALLAEAQQMLKMVRNAYDFIVDMEEAFEEEVQS